MSVVSLLLVISFLAAISAAAYFYAQNIKLKSTINSLGQLDETTQLPDGKATYARLNLLFDTAKRYRQPLTVAILQVSDIAADQAKHTESFMAQVAGELCEQLRGTDLLGRVKPDAFLIALSHTNTHNSRAVFERILNTVSTLKLNRQAVRISIGVSYLSAETVTIKQLLEFTQQALEDAKASSINQVQYRPS